MSETITKEPKSSDEPIVEEKKKKVKVPKITWGDRIGRNNLIYKYMIYQNTQYDGYHE